MPQGTFKVQDNVNLYRTDVKYGQHGNFFELFILPNGAIFMSEPFLEQVLEVGGLESLTFILLNNIAHVVKKH